MLVQHPLPPPTRPTTVQRASGATAQPTPMFPMALKAASTPAMPPSPPFASLLSRISLGFLKFPLGASRGVSPISRPKWTTWITKHKHADGG